MPKNSTMKISLGRTLVVNANILRRILAFIIDVAIIDLVLAIPFQGYFEKILPQKGLSTISQIEAISQTPAIGVIAFMLTIFLLVYFIVLEMKFGQTIGKMIMSINVSGTEKNKSIDLKGIIVRNLSIVFLFYFIPIFIIDALFAFFNEDHQRFAEKLSKTKVVQKITW